LLISKPDAGSFIHWAQRLTGLNAWFYSFNAAAVFRVRGGEHAEVRKANAGTGLAPLRHAALPKEVSGMKTTTILIGLAGLMVTAVAAAEVQDYATAATSEQPAQSEAKAPSGETAPTCCKAGDTTPPTELVKQVPKGQLHSPYPDYAKLAKDDPDLVKQFRLPVFPKDVPVKGFVFDVETGRLREVMAHDLSSGALDQQRLPASARTIRRRPMPVRKSRM
jgi:hypothetical protein